MIKFPSLHIADSVLNRIMNTLEGEGPLNSPVPAPIAPNPLAEGAEIDEKVNAPPMPAEPPPEAQQSAEDGLVSESLQGGSPFDGALMGTLGP